MRKTTSAVLASLVTVAAVSCGFAAGPVETAGDVLWLALPTFGAGVALWNSDGTGAMQLGASEALTLGVTFGLKYSVNERRPNGGAHSFPSGHASVSFSAAEFLRKRYGWEYGIPAYAVASFVGYSRVESRQHYIGDVVAGAVIGAVSSHFLTEPCDGWRVQMGADGQRYNVTVSRRF